MSGVIATDVQGLTQDVIVEMFELDLTQYSNGILRFTTTSVKGAPVFFNGYEYTPTPIKAEGFEWSGSGTLPRPKLEIAAKDIAFLHLIIGSQDIVGAEIKRIRTYRKYLDDGTHPNPTAKFDTEVYRINKKAGENKQRLVFELTPKMDQEGRMVPALQVIRDTCRHRFRKWTGEAWDYTGVTCPYTGDTLYDKNGEITGDPYKAQCGHRLNDCARHFGETAVLPYRGFPGVGRIK